MRPLRTTNTTRHTTTHPAVQENRSAWGMRSLRRPLVEGFCAACKPADRRPPWEWCEEHVQVDETSPLPGRWRSDASPWVRAVMEDFSNNAVRDIAVQCAAQSGKTQTVLNCACWAIAEDPGPVRCLGAFDRVESGLGAVLKIARDLPLGVVGQRGNQKAIKVPLATAGHFR